MTLKQIEREQAMANVKYEVAKKIAALMEEAKAEYKKLGGDSDGWESELETVQTLVFEEG